MQTYDGQIVAFSSVPEPATAAHALFYRTLGRYLGKTPPRDAAGGVAITAPWHLLRPKAPAAYP